MSRPTTATVRMMGALHTIRKERGLKSVTEVPIPEEGLTARQIARELDLPFDKIEGVFVNHICYALERRVLPGDKVAFVPTGVPGPHRYMLGIYNAGQNKEDEE